MFVAIEKLNRSGSESEHLGPSESQPISEKECSVERQVEMASVISDVIRLSPFVCPLLYVTVDDRRMGTGEWCPRSAVFWSARPR